MCHSEGMNVISKRCSMLGPSAALLALACLFHPVRLPAAEPAPGDAPVKDDVFGQFELLAEVMLSVKAFYHEDKTYDELLLGAIQGMLQALDPYSTFLTAEEYQALQDDTAGSYGGIGIHVSVRHGELVVIAPLEDTPGFAAGLQSGDRILAIDGEPVTGISIRNAVDRLRGPKGTTVVLEVLGRRQTESREVEIVRDRIEVASVKGARSEGDRVGYVRVTQFAQPTADLLREAVETLIRDEAITALVLDLRNNPGGLLDSAVDVAALFLPRGAPVVVVKGRPGVYEHQEIKADSPVRFIDMPLAVLINDGSASGSEIVAGALQDHRRAVVIGERSFGKGSVQRVMPSRQGAGTAIRLTAAHYYTPEGRLIHEVGVAPDIVVPVTPEEWRRVQLKRARDEHRDLVEDVDAEQLDEVTDRALIRAVDALKAARIFRERLR